MKKSTKVFLKKYFRHEWCPLFGTLPDFDDLYEDKDAREWIQVSEEARTYLGGAYLESFSNANYAARMALRQRGLASFKPDSAIKNHLCPDLDEIHREICITHKCWSEKEGGGRRIPRSIEEQFGISAAQILAVRKFHKRMESLCDDGAENVFEYLWNASIDRYWGREGGGIIKEWEIHNDIMEMSNDVYALIYEQNGHRINGINKALSLHEYFAADQVLAVVALSVAYLSLKQFVMGTTKPGDDCPCMGIELASKYMNSIIGRHIDTGKKSNEAGRFGILGGQYGHLGGKKKKGKQHKSALEKKRRWRNWANDIWRNHNNWKKIDVARLMKKQHPKIIDKAETIAKNITKPDLEV